MVAVSGIDIQWESNVSKQTLVVPDFHLPVFLPPVPQPRGL